ncbi:MAG: hypothetical protein ACRDOJ_12165 [Nocardioidaceae bacterium]
MTVPFDCDSDPERYRLGMQVARAHSSVSLYERVAAILTELGVGVVLDVGCCGRIHLRSCKPTRSGCPSVPAP